MADDTQKTKDEDDDEKDLEQELDKDDGPQVRDDESASGMRPRTDADNKALAIAGDDSLGDPSRVPVDETTESLPQEVEPTQDQSNDDLDKELAQNEPLVLPVDASKPRGSQPSIVELMQQYKALQDQRSKGDLVAGLAAAGAKIGQSMAGRYSNNFKPDLSGSELIQNMANRPVTDFEQKQIVQGRAEQLQSEISANDPNSPQSKLVREYLKQRIPGLSQYITDDMSASDAQNLIKQIGRQQIQHYQKGVGTATVNGQKQRVQASFDPVTASWIDNQGNRLPDFIQEGLTPLQFTKDSKGNIVQLNKSSSAVGQPPRVVSSSAYAPVESMTPEQVASFRPDKNQQKALDDEQKRIDGITKDTRQGLNAATNLENAIDTGSKFQGSILKTSVPHMVGFNGRMSPLEQNMWTGSQSVLGRLQQLASTASDSELSDENKAEAKKLIQLYRQGVSQNLGQINDGAQTKLQNVYSIPKSFSAKTMSVPSPAKVIASKGYNKDTNKTFLQYTDGTNEIVDGKR
jgi:hypothetical protein